jgi:PAS domain S-box-containing protein
MLREVYRRATQRLLWMAACRAFSTSLERPVPRYAAGLGIFALALALRFAILPIQGGIPFLTFYPAVMFAALLCGTGPALMVIALGAWAADYIFMEPHWAFNYSSGAIASVAVFTLSGLLICAIVHRNRKEEATRALLAAVVASSENAIVSKTLQGIVTSWNPEAERLFGYTAAEAIGKPMSILIPPQRPGEEAELLARIARGDRITHYETERVRKDGSTVAVAVNLSPIRDRLGRIVGASKIARDITEQKALEAAQALLASIVCSSGDAIISKSMQGTITSWNPAAERMFGYTAEEILGKPASTLYPLDRLDEVEALNSRNAKGEYIERFETVRLRKDGSLMSLSSSLSPLLDRSGHVVGVSVIAHDITARRDAEEHLAQMEARYRGLLEAAPDAIVVVDQGGEIVLVNAQAERQFGYRRDELLGQDVKNIIPRGFAERLIADGARSAAKALAQQIGMGIELDGRRKDGTAFPIEIMLSPLESSEGILVTAAIRDISKRRALEECLSQSNLRIAAAMAELKRSNKELDEFARVASHDLKEPLRGIHNYVSFLLEDYADRLDEQGRKYLGSMQRLAARMAALIDCLLDYSRLGSAPLAMEAINLETVLDEVAEDLRHFLIDHDVELRRAVRLPMVTGNAIRLGELLQNLITNGAKFNDKQDKWVEVGCEAAQATPVFSVRDNGIGIPEQHRESVFGIFKRLHTQDKFGGGTGAGLTVAKKIVERHGGRIWLESLPGEGTTFRFTLAAGLPEDSPAKEGS